MIAQEIIEKVMDISVSDRKVFNLLKQYLADKYDDGGNVVPPTTEELRDIDQISKIVRQLRPGVMRMLTKLAKKQQG